MSRDFRRRKFIKTVGAASVIGATGLAGCLEDDDEEETPTPDPDDPTPTPTPDEPEDAIYMASILPITGVLEDLGPPMQDAVNLAVDHINEAGGPLDRQIDMTNLDSETRPDAGFDRYETIVADEDIQAIIGAASSGVSSPIAQQVASDQVMQISPASTSPVFTDFGWDGDIKYFGRTAPNDAQQGIVMARILNNEEYLDADTAGFLYVDNPYGEGLADQAREEFDGETVAFVGYDAEATDFTSTLDSLFEDDPEAIGFVGYPGEGRPILNQWDELGYGGDWILSEGLDSPEFLEDMEELIEGFHMTTPQPEETPGSEAFHDEIDAAGPFAPHSYDATMIAALAMEYAGEATGTAIAENFLEVCNPPGEVVTVGEFQEAKDLIADGEDIQYEGASSPLEMTDYYENLNRFAIVEISGAEKTTLEVLEREFFEGVLPGT